MPAHASRSRASVEHALRRLLDRLGALQGTRTQQRLLVAAAVAFVVFSVLAVSDLNLDWGQLRWAYVVPLLVVAVPASMVVNGLEYVLAGRAVGRRPPLHEVFQVTVLGSAANLLPIPGAAAVRVAYLRRGGAAYGRSVGATLVVAVAWIHVSLAAAAAALLATARWRPGLAFVAVTLALTVLLFLLARSRTPGALSRSRLVTLALAVETASVVLIALRLGLLLRALGADAGVVESLTLAVSVAVAAAVGIFPGGLGIREAISAALAPLVGLPASLGFLVAALNRLAGLVLLGPLAALGTLLRGPHDPAAVADEPERTPAREEHVGSEM